MGVLDRFDLSGRTALVTGCRRGIGKAMAVALAEAGADIVGVSAGLEAEGSDVARAVEAAGRRFTAHQCDFSDRAALHRFLAEIEHGPPIDILINNAGTIRRGTMAEHAEADWDLVVEVNLTAPFLIAQHVGRRMAERGWGRIVFVASVLSFQGGILVPGYAATKAAIANVTRAFANEWAARGVSVNAIAPGYFATDLNAALREDPKRSPELLSRVPAGRYGDTAELGGITVMLASDAASYLHGAVIPVDGGWMAR